MEELENGALEAEEFAAWIQEQAELQLMQNEF